MIAGTGCVGDRGCYPREKRACPQLGTAVRARRSTGWDRAHPSSREWPLSESHAASRRVFGNHLQAEAWRVARIFLRLHASGKSATRSLPKLLPASADGKSSRSSRGLRIFRRERRLSAVKQSSCELPRVTESSPKQTCPVRRPIRCSNQVLAGQPKGMPRRSQRSRH